MPSSMSPTRDSDLPLLDADFEKDTDEFLRGIAVDRNDTVGKPQTPAEPAKAADEEIKIRKKRVPNLKLDDTLLISNNGIPKLRRVAKHKLRFKGKGHEFSDMCLLLNTYQLWLDDLYPKAKYRDALAMVEKLGHSKKMQVMRRSWIDATKPNGREDSPEAQMDVSIGGALSVQAVGQEESNKDGGAGQHDAQSKTAYAIAQQDVDHGDVPEDDELDMLFAEGAPQNAPHTAQPTPERQARPMFWEEQYEPIDDLDALLAENAAQKEKTASFVPTRGADGTDPKADKLDALLAEESRSKVTDANANGSGGRLSNNNTDFADDEEAMAEMEALW